MTNKIGQMPIEVAGLYATTSVSSSITTGPPAYAVEVIRDADSSVAASVFTRIPPFGQIEVRAWVFKRRIYRGLESFIAKHSGEGDAG